MKQFSVSILPSPLNSHPMHFISMVERDLSKLLSDQKLIDFFLNDSRTRDGLLEAKHILSITPQLEKYFPRSWMKNWSTFCRITSRLWGEPTCSSSWSIVITELTDWLVQIPDAGGNFSVAKLQNWTSISDPAAWISSDLPGHSPAWLEYKNVVIFRCWNGVARGANQLL